jgi:hypothetical protein
MEEQMEIFDIKKARFQTDATKDANERWIEQINEDIDKASASGLNFCSVNINTQMSLTLLFEKCREAGYEINSTDYGIEISW